MCEDYLHINRDHWRKKQIKFQPKLYKIHIKEVRYMNRTEFLIDKFDPILNEIDDKEAFKVALEEKNIFLLEIQGQQVKTLKQINRLIRENTEQIEILVGMPLLHSVQVPQRRTEVEQSSDSDNSIRQRDSDLTKRIKSSTDKITLIMMNNDLLQTFQAKAVVKRNAEVIYSLKKKNNFILIFFSIYSTSNLIVISNLKSVQLNNFSIYVYGVNHHLIVTYQIITKNLYYSVM
jgi:hypothetical protein